jgi:hypothetical protein
MQQVVLKEVAHLSVTSSRGNIVQLPAAAAAAAAAGAPG